MSLKFSCRWQRSIGFTLVEMLLVVAILSVLAGIIMVVVFKVRQKGAETQCIAQMRQIYQALLMYQGDFDDLPPWHSLVPALYPSYIKERSIFICPFDAARFEQLRKKYEHDPEHLKFLELHFTSYSYYYDFPSPSYALRKIGGRSFREAYEERGEDTPLLACGHHHHCGWGLDHQDPAEPKVFLVVRMSGEVDKVIKTCGGSFVWNQL